MQVGLFHTSYSGLTDPGAEFNEVQTDKRNAYKSKVASKAAGHGGHGEDGNDGEGDSIMDREGQPASKKARLDPDESMGALDASEIREGYSRADHTADEEGDEGGDETEEDEDEGEERLEVEEQLEEPEEKEDQDEALDNGEDSE